MTKLLRPLGREGGNTRVSPIPALRDGATVGMRWRFRRNLVIYVAHKNGFSQRILSDVFDLPRSRIAAIIKEVTVIEESMGPNFYNAS